MSWLRSKSLQATGNFTCGGVDSATVLGFVNVNTAAASAVLTLKEKDTNGAVIATIDASATGTKAYFSTHRDGVYCALSGGNADITVTFS